MAAILHFTWIQKRSTETAPLDKARAIKRDDPWIKTIEFYESDGTTLRPITGTITGQLRLEPLTEGVTEPTPVATMTIDDTNKAAGSIVVSLPREITRDLPSKGFYDIQIDGGATIMEGKWAVADDVTRVPL